MNLRTRNLLLGRRLLPTARIRSGIVPELLLTIVFVMASLPSGASVVSMAGWADWRGPILAAFSIGFSVLVGVHGNVSNRGGGSSRWRAAMTEMAPRFGWAYVAISAAALLLALVSGDPSGDYLHSFWWSFTGARIAHSHNLQILWVTAVALCEALSIGLLVRGVIASGRCLLRGPTVA